MNEDQFAWAKLAKGVIGTDNVDATMGDELPANALLGLPRATINQACAPGGVIILMGADPKERLGTLYLRLRHAVTQDKASLIELTPTATGLSGLAAATLRARPGDTGDVARALVAGGANNTVGGVSAEEINAAHALLDGRPVTVVVGRTSLAESPTSTLEAVSALAELPGVRFLPGAHRANVMGAMDMGLAPGLLPGRISLADGVANVDWPNVPASAGSDTVSTLERAAGGEIDVLFLLGADPLADAPDPDTAKRALDTVPLVVAIDLFASGSVRQANVILPAASFVERDGSTTNIEGRVAAVRQKVTPPGTARADWVIAAEIAERMGADLGFAGLEDIWSEIARVSGPHHGLSHAAIAEAPDGIVVSGGSLEFQPPTDRGAAQPLDGYAFRLVATKRMFDQGALVQQSDSLAALADRARIRVNPSDFNALGVAAGTPVRVTSPAGSLEIPIHADPAVPKRTAVADVNQAGADVRVLFVPDARAVDVRIETTESAG